ncbi:oxidoreductase [Pseudovibrio sp. Tun.PSC04-5.I4]|uniref:oxidoreductase n=1 Tax=Pseudovibrio sp. Tun.PSC04-5.I4 TaxID=1798213 RepID=UPI00088F946E|nr:oxidoreductase [Pseudovibrio sp. Tun.PSC04-5.I4]SDR32216.1 NAD(P)-dependent dehydrogenase, short-chain alcohol dehydrogenase family [Pseudovibrio sp. Tun.PSC04-5.I4]
MSGMNKSSAVSNWTADKLPSLEGKLYVITGGNSGIGFEAARMLSEAGGDVVIACRNTEKGTAAQKALQARSKSKIGLVHLDLSDLTSVRRAAEFVLPRYTRIDGLINNAGIMQTPQLKSVDGYELQLATNHLGHFLWAGLLKPNVEAAEGRFVIVASLVHKMGKINFDDLMLRKSYAPMRAYGQSKLATLMFALELQRRLTEAGSKSFVAAGHPGYSATHLQSTGPTGLMNQAYKVMNKFFAQPAMKGALPTVLAAAGLEAEPGGYYGPQKRMETVGPVGEAQIASHALRPEVARKLWGESEWLVDFKWAF